VSVRLYLDVEGVSYRVHDTTFSQRKHTIVPLGDPRAQFRMFVTKDGAQRSYRFTRTDAHGVTEEFLVRQLRAAGYPAREEFDASKLTPERRER
jgi:hypothetical protein